jgi:hypothetical protein
MYIKIENYGTMEVDDVSTCGYGIMITSGNMEFYIFPSREEAGRAARKYWEDMAYFDKAEFVCIVGEETLVSWALGEFAGPGYTHVSSLEEWLDLWLDVPEEQWAGYDGSELDVERIGHLVHEIGWDELDDPVAYRHN